MRVVVDIDAEGLDNLEPGASERVVDDIKEAIRDYGLDNFVLSVREF